MRIAWPPPGTSLALSVMVRFNLLLLQYGVRGIVSRVGRIGIDLRHEISRRQKLERYIEVSPCEPAMLPTYHSLPWRRPMVM